MSYLRAFLACLPAVSVLAIPRFAVRTGYDCSACHVNPTGGGMRSPYGRNVFVRQWLTMLETAEAEEDAFSPELNRHVAIGADLRTGYLWQNSLDDSVRDTSTLFTPQVDLYLHLRAGEKVALYWDQGVYGGFEAFALVRPLGETAGRDFYLKAGRFHVPFGLREVNHTIWTREAVGFGATDRDHGFETGLRLGRFAGQVAIVNGTYGASFFDINGSEKRSFEKAAAARLTHRFGVGPLRIWTAASVLYNDNVDQQNPLFPLGLLTGDQSRQVSQGVNEWRAGGFLGLGLGRMTYSGELVFVRDQFTADIRSLAGYTSYQEVAWTILRGLDVAASYEFADSDAEFERGRISRMGGIVEVFPIRFIELRGMVRHVLGPSNFVLGGARDDVEIFVHLYL